MIHLIANWFLFSLLAMKKKIVLYFCMILWSLSIDVWLCKYTAILLLAVMVYWALFDQKLKEGTSKTSSSCLTTKHGIIINKRGWESLYSHWKVSDIVTIKTPSSLNNDVFVYFTRHTLFCSCWQTVCWVIWETPSKLLSMPANYLSLLLLWVSPFYY